MAVSTMEYNEICILDRCPSPAHVGQLPAADSSGQYFTNSSHTSTTNPVFKPGYKIAVFDETEQGWTYLAYLNYITNTDTEGVTGAGEICVPTDTTTAQYKVSSESDSGVPSLNSYIAVGLGDMTTTYWYFFWVGGVAPTSYCSDLAATSAIIITDTNVDRCDGLAVYDEGATNNQIGLLPTASAVNTVAFALADDD